MRARAVLLLGLLGAPAPIVAQSPVVKVEIYTAANVAGLDTALMDRPTWGVIKARVTRRNGTIDTVSTVHWKTWDSTKVRFRKVTAQSVAIESPLSAKLGTTKITANLNSKYDTLVAVVRNGIVGTSLDSASYTLPGGTKRQICRWFTTLTGGRFLTPESATVLYCQNHFPNQP